MNLKSTDVRERLDRLAASYTRCMERIHALSEAGELGKIDGFQSVGHWGFANGMSTVQKEWGISNGSGQLFNARGDNIEGSLYPIFEGHALRIRLAGFVALYLNSSGNSVRVDWDWDTERYVLSPERLGGEPISAVERSMVRIKDEAFRNYDNEVWRLRMAYEEQVRQARTLPRKVARTIAALFGQEAAEPTLILPKAPPDAYRSIEELVFMIDTMRDGLDRISDILASCVPTPA